eukprot:jgi/Mesen1/6558/ME000334S05890
MAPSCNKCFISVLALVLLISIGVQGRHLEKDLLVVGEDGGIREEICELCQKFSTDMSSVLANPKSSNDTISLLKTALCSQFPGSLQDQCKEVVEEYVPEAFVALQEVVTEEALCLQTGICSTLAPSPLTGLEDSSKCQICEVLFTQVLTVLESEKVQARVLEALTKACSKLHAEGAADKCEALVTEYYPQLLLLLQSVTPQEFCSLARYCPASASASASASTSASEKAPAVVSVNSAYAELEAALGVQQPSECQVLLARAQRMASCKKKQGRVAAALATTCSKHASPALQAECEEEARSFTTQVMGTLQQQLQEATPALCGRPALPPRRVGGVVCDACESMYQQAVQVLGSQKLQQELLADLHAACSYIPTTGSTEKCDVMVDQYYQAAIQLLQSTTPTEFCHDAAHLCSPAPVKLAPLSRLASALGFGPQQCAECRFVVKEAQKKLKEPANQVKLTTFLTETCNKFPDYEVECLALIEQYLPELFANLDTLLDPLTVCTKISFCKGSGAASRRERAASFLQFIQLPGAAAKI